MISGVETVHHAKEDSAWKLWQCIDQPYGTIAVSLSGMLRTGDTAELFYLLNNTCSLSL
jgi:hypothetical protein